MREVLKEYEIRLQSGEVRNEDLLVAKSVRQKSKRVQGGKSHRPCPAAVGEAGIEIHPGEKVHYLMKDYGVEEQRRPRPRLPLRQRR